MQWRDHSVLGRPEHGPAVAGAKPADQRSGDRAAVDLLPCRGATQNDGDIRQLRVHAEFRRESDGVPLYRGKQRSVDADYEFNDQFRSGAGDFDPCGGNVNLYYRCWSGKSEHAWPDPAVYGWGHCVLAEHHYGRAYGESVAGIEPGVHAGRQQRQISVRSEPVLDELDDAEQFDLCVHYSKQRHVAVCSRCTEQSLSYWSGAGVHGRGSIEPVHLHVEWGWDGHGQGAG